MRRRTLLFSIGAVTIPRRVFAWTLNKDENEVRIVKIQQVLAARRSGGRPISANSIVELLVSKFAEPDRRIAAYRLVQDVPYKLTSWTGDPDSLFNLGRGDCRHKSAALLRLFKALSVDARHILVIFDWADLPIPSPTLKLLSETRGFHDTVEIQQGGSKILVDPTWDPDLASAGFPVLTSWNGIDATLPITPKATVVIRDGDFPKGADLYATFGIRWPERKRTLAFNRAFNAWTDEIRKRESTAAK